MANESSPGLSDEERREVARVVGIGAVKYNDLSRDRQSLVSFTWDKALALTGNTAPYLQYAYARIRSILRKAEAEGARPGALGALAPIERALVLRLFGFGEAVEQVARSARPHTLADYLYDAGRRVLHLLRRAPGAQGRAGGARVAPDPLRAHRRYAEKRARSPRYRGARADVAS